MGNPSPPVLSKLVSILILVLLFHHPPASATTISDAPVYFSKPGLLGDYQKMVSRFKIFVYEAAEEEFNFTATPSQSVFYASLMKSQFLTRHPEEANLFFLPFQPQSTRSLTRLIQRIRTSHPFWDTSLGSDHFYLSCRGVGPSSSRNVVELKKNAIQVSCFPSPTAEFVPHKDVSLPPLTSTALSLPLPLTLQVSSASDHRILGYWKFNPLHPASDLIPSLTDDPDFLIESEPSDHSSFIQRLETTKFCLFPYEVDQMELLPAALTHGCVPVVITDRPIQDLPLMDLIRWSEIALFVGSHVGQERLKRLMITTCESGRYEKMRRLGAAAAHHFLWNESPQPYDAFHMVIYQLWLRRHSIRYVRWEPK